MSNNIIGQLFGAFKQLKVLKRSDRIDSQGFKRYYWYKCLICGIEKEADKWLITTNTLKSCGNSENCSATFKIISDAATIHGHTKNKFYNKVRKVIQRCYDDTELNYINYGGRGIIVYQPWLDDVELFYDYLETQMPETIEQFEARTGQKATLDRINVNGNYEPENLRWATDEEQQQNKTNNVFNESLVKYALWLRYLYNFGTIRIFEELKLQGYTGSRYPVGKVLNRNLSNTNICWNNINIDKEIAEYEEFGTVNGIVIPKV
jgi:hypothetical protein